MTGIVRSLQYLRRENYGGEDGDDLQITHLTCVDQPGRVIEASRRYEEKDGLGIGVGEGVKPASVRRVFEAEREMSLEVGFAVSFCKVNEEMNEDVIVSDLPDTDTRTKVANRCRCSPFMLLAQRNGRTNHGWTDKTIIDKTIIDM